ncbi:DUF6313 family protein [Streptomyces sp. NPDC059002]|uniref:DUF6313 family protein n=1 Tax=Streptomyces sp. NPDC059002 TaxID=3346690 RepID=UPI00368C77BC
MSPRAIRRLAVLHQQGGEKSRFAESYVLRHGQWLTAQDHWEQVVSMFLGCKEVGDLSGAAAVDAAERYAREALMSMLTTQRHFCPVCERP